jgi:hypothetical protein
MGIKISDISSELLKNPDISKKFDKKYIDGLIKERLAVLDYKKTFPNSLNEQEDKDEEDIELEPEKLPIPDIEDTEDIQISDEPELIPTGEEEVIEVEPEPEITPEKLPVPITPEIEKKQAEYETISREQARELLSYKGKIFTAVFTKREDGTIRALNGLTGVRKYTSGGELPYSPKENNLIPVYDLKIGNGRKGYRMIPLEGLKTLNINGKKYKIDPFLKEIKINKPVSTPEEIIKNLIKDKSAYCVDRVMKKYGYGWIKFSGYGAFYDTLNSEQKSSLFKELNNCKKL